MTSVRRPGCLMPSPVSPITPLPRSTSFCLGTVRSASKRSPRAGSRSPWSFCRECVAGREPGSLARDTHWLEPPHRRQGLRSGRRLPPGGASQIPGGCHPAHARHKRNAVTGQEGLCDHSELLSRGRAPTALSLSKNLRMHIVPGSTVGRMPHS